MKISSFHEIASLRLNLLKKVDTEISIGARSTVLKE
jgi:hypothetical protein